MTSLVVLGRLLIKLVIQNVPAAENRSFIVPSSGKPTERLAIEPKLRRPVVERRHRPEARYDEHEQHERRHRPEAGGLGRFEASPASTYCAKTGHRAQACGAEVCFWSLWSSFLVVVVHRVAANGRSQKMCEEELTAECAEGAEKRTPRSQRPPRLKKRFFDNFRRGKSYQYPDYEMLPGRLSRGLCLRYHLSGNIF